MSGKLDPKLLLLLASEEIKRRQHQRQQIPELLRVTFQHLQIIVAANGQLTAADGEESGSALPGPDPFGVSADEAAQRLGCSPRTVRRLGSRLGGRKVGGTWVFDRRAVEEHAEGMER